jgi:hypothetical protein
MHRFHQALLITATVCLSWLGTTAVHQFGHRMYATISGGELTRAPLHPLKFNCPRQLANARPLVTWGGVIWGCAIPLALLWLARATVPGMSYLAQFFAGFCLAANGTYLVVGSIIPAGDAAALMRYGVPQWLLVLFGFPAILAGIGIWHGLGPRFGLGNGGRVDRPMAWAVTTAVVLVVAGELLATL